MFDEAMAEPKFHLDQGTINDVKKLLDNTELYLSSK